MEAIMNTKQKLKVEEEKLEKVYANLNEIYGMINEKKVKIWEVCKEIRDCRVKKDHIQWKISQLKKMIARGF